MSVTDLESQFLELFSRLSCEQKYAIIISLRLSRLALDPETVVSDHDLAPENQ